jgi:competence protein ComEC
VPTAAFTAAALALGILMGRLRCLSLSAALILFALVMVWALWWQGRKNMRCTGTLLLLVAAAGMVLSVQAWTELEQEAPWPPGLTPGWSGTIARVPRLSAESTRVVVRTPAGHVQITVPGRQPHLLPGDQIVLNRIPARPARATNPGQYDARVHVGLQGIHWQLFLSADDDWEHRPVLRPSLLRAGAVLAGRWQQIYLDTLPDHEAHLLSSLVLGQRGDLDSKTVEWFQQTGLSHLLAVSGFHVGFAVLLVGLVGRLVGQKGSMLTVTKLLGLWLFAAAAGLQTGVVRAALMVSVSLGAEYFRRDQNPAATLGVAAICILGARPLSLFDPGFQLSFAATAGILWGMRWMQMHPAGRGNWFVRSLTLSLAVQAAVLPLTAAHFHRIVWTVPLTQLLAAPLTGLAVLLGLCTGWAGMVWLPLAEAFSAVNQMVLSGLLILLETLARWPLHGWHTPAPGILWILGWYALLAWYVKTRRTERRRAHRGLVALALLIWLTLWIVVQTVFPFPENVRVTVLDVGQGDAMLIQTRGGHHVLLDGGNRLSGEGWVLDQGTRVVLPFLRQAGVQRLDALYSHAHDDHIGGLTAVVAAGMVQHLWAPAQPGNTQNWQDLQAVLAAQSVLCTVLQAGDVLQLGANVRLDVLAPPAGGIPGVPQTDLNNHSLVLLLTAGNQRMLLTGDLEQEGIRWLFSQRDGPRAEILKVPHHGSSGSLDENWYRAVGAEWAIIPVGPNRFGHPGADVVETLGEQARVYRTDRDGAVEFRLFAHRIRVRTHRERIRIWRG